MSRPGIEPGSPQPQCGILTTVRSRPKKCKNIKIQVPHILSFNYTHSSYYLILSSIYIHTQNHNTIIHHHNWNTKIHTLYQSLLYRLVLKLQVLKTFIIQSYADTLCTSYSVCTLVWFVYLALEIQYMFYFQIIYM